MSCQLKIEYYRAIYHVISIGNSHQIIFSSDDVHYYFNELLEELSGCFEVNIFSYGMNGKSAGFLP